MNTVKRPVNRRFRRYQFWRGRGEFVFRSTKPEILSTHPGIFSTRLMDGEKRYLLRALLNTFAQRIWLAFCNDKKNHRWPISGTDYVFGLMTERWPYVESDVPPGECLRCSKLAGKNFIRYSLKKILFIRPAGLFGIAGRQVKGGNFIETMFKDRREREWSR